jgi:hypothetical protein
VKYKTSSVIFSPEEIKSDTLKGLVAGHYRFLVVSVMQRFFRGFTYRQHAPSRPEDMIRGYLEHHFEPDPAPEFRVAP